MNINGTMTVKCNNCGEEHTFTSEETDFDCTSSDEREMGQENEFTCKTTIECECGNQIEIEYNVWEYPTGAFNDDDVNIKGGTLIDKFDIDFQENPEPDDL